MHILANRINSPNAHPDIASYQIVKGGGILKKGERITVIRYPATSDAARREAESGGVLYESVQNNLRLGVGVGTACKSTLPIISEGIGIPKIFEVQLFGRTKFQGLFTKNSIELVSRGITNPHVESRQTAMKGFVRAIAEKRDDIASIDCEAKSFPFNIHMGFRASINSSEAIDIDLTCPGIFGPRII